MEFIEINEHFEPVLNAALATQIIFQRLLRDLIAIMKGIMFCEFTHLVEEVFGEEMVNQLILATHPASGGNYSCNGTYNHQELIAMTEELSEQTGIPSAELTQTFGRHLAGVFTREFAYFFEGCNNTIDLLKKLDAHIHEEIQQIYPDAELPTLSFIDISETECQLRYESTRHFSQLAQGLIDGCIEYFGESYQMTSTDTDQAGATETLFTLRKLI